MLSHPCTCVYFVCVFLFLLSSRLGAEGNGAGSRARYPGYLSVPSAVAAGGEVEEIAGRAREQGAGHGVSGKREVWSRRMRDKRSEMTECFDMPSTGTICCRFLTKHDDSKTCLGYELFFRVHVVRSRTVHGVGRNQHDDVGR